MPATAPVTSNWVSPTPYTVNPHPASGFLAWRLSSELHTKACQAFSCKQHTNAAEYTGVSEIRGPLFWGSYNKDPTI